MTTTEEETNNATMTTTDENKVTSSPSPSPSPLTLPTDDDTKVDNAEETIDQAKIMADDNTTITGNKKEDKTAAEETAPTPPTDTNANAPAITTNCDTNFASRFPLWYALLVFSAVTLISLLTETPSSRVWFAEEKWILSVALMSLMLSCMGCLAQFAMRQNFVGMPLEGLVLFTELGFWVGGLIVMMDTDNSLAVDANGGILNANLYFFSWLSLITTVCLLVQYGEQVNDNVMVTSGNIASAGYWAGICVASLVALASSSELFIKGVTLQGNEYECQDGQDHGSGFCERLKFSIALGVIGTVFAGVCSLLSFKMTTAVNASASFLMLFAWAFGVAFVTFGDKSPGNSVGNLYFSSWFAFVLSLFMVSTSMRNYLAEREERSVTETEQDNKGIGSDPSSNTERGEDPRVEDEEEKTASPSEGPLTPASAATPKLEVKSGDDDGSDEQEEDDDDEGSVDPNVPVSNVDIPAPV